MLPWDPFPLLLAFFRSLGGFVFSVAGVILEGDVTLITILLLLDLFDTNPQILSLGLGD